MGAFLIKTGLLTVVLIITSYSEDIPSDSGAKFPSVSIEQDRLGKEGKTWLMVESTAKASLIFSGLYTTIFPKKDIGVIASATLLSMGATYYGTKLYASYCKDLSYGKVGLLNYGSTLFGMYYPFLISDFLHYGTAIDDAKKRTAIYPYSREPYIYYDDGTITDYVRPISSLIGFPLGIYLGSRILFKDKPDYYRVAFMEYFSQTFGFLLGYSLPRYINFNIDNHYYTESSLLAMLLLPGGFYSGYLMSEANPHYIDRGAFLYLTGAMGCLSGYFLPNINNYYYHMGIKNTAYLTTLLAGYAGGTYLGIVYHPKVEFSYLRTAFIGAISAAGALVGIGLPLLFQIEYYDIPGLFTISGIAGMWTGFFLGEKLSENHFPKVSRLKQGVNLNVNLSGLALLPVINSHYSAIQNHPATRVAVPVAEVCWLF
jgi:hypothetical protein